MTESTKNTPKPNPFTTNLPPQTPQHYIYTLQDACVALRDALGMQGESDEILRRQTQTLDHLFTTYLTRAIENAPHKSDREVPINPVTLDRALQVQRQCVETARVSGGLSYMSTIADVMQRRAVFERLNSEPPPPAPQLTRNEMKDDPFCEE